MVTASSVVASTVTTAKITSLVSGAATPFIGRSPPLRERPGRRRRGRLRARRSGRRDRGLCGAGSRRWRLGAVLDRTVRGVLRERSGPGPHVVAARPALVVVLRLILARHVLTAGVGDLQGD